MQKGGGGGAAAYARAQQKAGSRKTGCTWRTPQNGMDKTMVKAEMPNEPERCGGVRDAGGDTDRREDTVRRIGSEHQR